MRLLLIACKVIQREAYLCAARSKNIVDVLLMPQGLHETPDQLRLEVQKALEQTSDIQGRPYDAALLGYGLCSNGIVGVSAQITMVVPRAHDCITLLLGSKERYRQYFDSHRGVYWFSPGWIESGKQPGPEYLEQLRRQYEEKYGSDNADYLIQTEQGWMKEYNWAAYIDWQLADAEHYKQYTKKSAQFLGWNYDELKGDPSLLQRFLDGDWNDAEFLTVRPGQKITEDLTQHGIIKAE